MDGVWEHGKDQSITADSCHCIIIGRRDLLEYCGDTQLFQLYDSSHDDYEGANNGVQCSVSRSFSFIVRVRAAMQHDQAN